MAIRGQQAICDHKPRPGESRPQPHTPVREADVIDAVHVADRIAIPIQHHRRHSLLLLKQLDLIRKLLNLVLKVVRWSRRVEMYNHRGAQQ